MLARIGLAASLLFAAGCLTYDGSGGVCHDDGDCNGVCTHGGECAAAGSERYVRIDWTIDGETPNPQDPSICTDAGIVELSVSFADDDPGSGENLSYRPVPCANGQIVFDKLHPRFDRTTLTAHGSGSAAITAATERLHDGENLILFNLLD